MSTDVTMQELELESAELLPSRETLSCSRGGSNHTNITNVIGNTLATAVVAKLEGEKMHHPEPEGALRPQVA